MTERDALEYFVDRGGKLVVSLGGRKCPVNCAHCYVFAPGFKFFPRKSPTDLVTELVALNQDYNIVYLSGDIEPFLDESQAVEFLRQMAGRADVDLLFSTRMVLSSETLTALAEINNIQVAKGRLLIGTVSIPALDSYRRIEPGKMVPSPKERVGVLQSLARIPIPTMAALRPVFPAVIVSPEEYRRLLALVAPHSTVILGELLFLDTEGVLEQRLQFKVAENDVFVEQMSFFAQDREWKVCRCDSQIAVIREECIHLNKPFYMRSMPGVELIRSFWNPQTADLGTDRIYPLAVPDYDDQMF